MVYIDNLPRKREDEKKVNSTAFSHLKHSTYFHGKAAFECFSILILIKVSILWETGHLFRKSSWKWNGAVQGYSQIFN